jgi:putative endonuclease
MPKPGYVYLLASRRNGTLYVGATSDLLRRVGEHRAGAVPGFTARYGVRRLVYYEAYPDIRDAVERERRLKEWRRAWKVALIEAANPEWTDPYPAMGPGHGRDFGGAPGAGSRLPPG